MQKSRLCNFQYLIGFLGLLAVTAGIAAEFTRNKAKDVRYEEGGCSLPSSPASALGTTAALSLLLAQLTANVIGGCLCCARDLCNIPTCNRLAVMILIFSWMTFAIAIYLFVAGSSMSGSQPFDKPWLDNECYIVKAGVFGGAAALSFLTVILDILYYTAITAKRSEDLPMTSSVMPMAAVPSAMNSENFLNPQHGADSAGNIEFNCVNGSTSAKFEI